MGQSDKKKIRELEEKISNLEGELRYIKSDFTAVHVLLDELGAPRLQDNGVYPFSPVGRLRRVSYESLGKSRQKIYEDQIDKIHKSYQKRLCRIKDIIIELTEQGKP